jgi:hypothetical protein
MEGLAPEAQTQFRADVRAWLKANVPVDPKPPITREGHEQAAYLRRW